MADRRRSPRYVFFAPADARACTVHEAVVEQWDGDCAVVLTTHAAVCGDEYLMQFSSPSGEPTRHAARVTSTALDTTGGIIRYRLRLALSSTTSDETVAAVAPF
jgi:hypothetical protein